MLRSCLLLSLRCKSQAVPQPLLLLLSKQQRSSTSIQQARRSSSKARVDVPIGLPSVCIWGANTGVGKTLISAGLVAAAVRNKVGIHCMPACSSDC